MKPRSEPLLTTLTRSDALTMLAFFSHADASESDRLQLTEVSRTSYHDSRRRIYGARWIEDRYVPSPAWLGYPLVGFGLSRPLADHQDEYLRAAASFPGAVTLWVTAGCAFGMFYLRDGTEGDRVAAAWSDPTRVSDATFVMADPLHGEVPVFFDYEGLWSHLCGRMGTTGYPRGPPVGEAPLPLSSQEFARSLLQEVGSLVRGNEPVYLHRTIGLRRSQQVLFDKGYLSRRVVLGPGRTPPYEGRDVNRLLFVSGTTQSLFSPSAFLSTLAGGARVFPYLLAGGRGKCLVAFLGQAEAPPQSESAAAFSSRLLPALRSQLSDIKVFQGEIASFVPWLHHAYDRLVPANSGQRSR